MRSQVDFQLTRHRASGERPILDSAARRRIGLRRSRRWQGLTLTLVGIVVGGVMLVTTGEAAPARAAHPAVVDDGGIGPVSSWLTDYRRQIRRARRALKKSSDVVASMEGGPVLWTVEQASLATHLAEADAAIALLLDPLESPSLQPTDAGVIDPSVAPTSLAQYATETLALAQDAEFAAEFDPKGTAEFVGTQLRTIEHLLSGYREAAGIANEGEA